MSNRNLYVDLHLLHTVPPSCLNRDDTGSPKTAIYGGTKRARVSSQAWKKAMRDYFAEHMDEDKLGKRTKKLVALAADEIRAIAPELDAEKLAVDALKQAGLKIDEKKNENDALFFISHAQVKALAETAVEQAELKEKEKDKKLFKEALKNGPSCDIALFGRMVASDPTLNYDAAAQVAHSISTHTVSNEYDYFTAVDDCAPEDNAGAGHLGTVEFNSATLYRYATVNVAELYENLGEDTPTVVRDFAEAFIRSMPTGKQNSFANRTMPDMVYITVRGDQSVNLCGAFEEPVRSVGGYVSGSTEALRKYAEKTYAKWVDKPALALSTEEKFSTLAEILPLNGILDKLESYISGECEGLK